MATLNGDSPISAIWGDHERRDIYAFGRGEMERARQSVLLGYPVSPLGEPVVIEDHSGGTLHPHAGFKSQEPVGLFPVFELAKGPASLTFSPPDLKITNLGPIQLNYRKQKQRCRERTNRRFIRGYE